MKIEFLIIKEENETCNSIKTFKSFLNSNSELQVADKIIIHKRFKVNYKLKTNLINNPEKTERYFLFTIERDSLSGLLEKKLEHYKRFNIDLNKFIDIKRALKKILEESKIGFYVIILFDETSSFFSKISYPLINEVENLMRKLIFKFMFMNIGINWLSKNAPKDFIDAVNKNLNRNKNKKLFIQESLFETDFIDLKDFLFKCYNNSNPDDILKLIDKAKRINDLDLKKLKEIVPKSNWDRYFSKYVTINKLDEKWEKLYSLRNKIAHNKLINRGDYEEIQKLTKEIKKSLLTAIDKLDDINFTEIEKKEVTASLVLENITKSLLDFSNSANPWISCYENIIKNINWVGKSENYLKNYYHWYDNNIGKDEKNNNENTSEDKNLK